MSQRVPSLCLLLAATVVTPALATNQTPDVVRYEGLRGVLLERPLEALWRDHRPEFDPQDTANRKGYKAAWEIRESKLYLTFFDAMSNGHPVSIARFVPGSSLPVHAKWYTGTLHVGFGEPTNPGSIKPNYGRILAVDIEDGILVRVTESAGMNEFGRSGGVMSQYVGDASSGKESRMKVVVISRIEMEKGLTAILDASISSAAAGDRASSDEKDFGKKETFVAEMTTHQFILFEPYIYLDPTACIERAVSEVTEVCAIINNSKTPEGFATVPFLLQEYLKAAKQKKELPVSAHVFAQRYATQWRSELAEKVHLFNTAEPGESDDRGGDGGAGGPGGGGDEAR